ncbi:MAG: DUF3344 domain-containing protein [Deltaproteobacteria bacterium]|nr:MAG: DUF3344 domain-containing protein [Deltaproteobacteria bacterium]
MKRTISLAVSLALAVLVLVPPAWAELGYSTGIGPRNVIDVTVAPAFTLRDVKHVANGVALRNRASGWIHLRGVPPGSTVIRAHLYWNISDGLVKGPASSATFNGNLVAGLKRADNPDPCWGLTGNHTYRADVTPFVPRNNPNQDYLFALQKPDPLTTSGENPWTLAPVPTLLTEGATLIVTYRHPEKTIGAIVNIYDAFSGTMFSTSGTFTLTHAALSGGGLFTMTGADGQRGGGHDNVFSNETGTFNGAQFSGPTVAASDWDGSTGLPLTQLWDVHTHIVQLNGTSSTVAYTGVGDCLVPVAFVIQLGLND